MQTSRQTVVGAQKGTLLTKEQAMMVVVQLINIVKVFLDVERSLCGRAYWKALQAQQQQCKWHNDAEQLCINSCGAGLCLVN